MVSKSYRAISVVFDGPKVYYRSSFSRTVCSRTLGPVVSLNELNLNNDISEDTSDRRYQLGAVHAGVFSPAYQKGFSQCCICAVDSYPRCIV